MSRFYIYAIRDELQDKFKQPMFFSRPEEAARTFSFMINEDKFMKSNASDFGLYHVGFYDDENGMIESIMPTKEIGGSSIKKED